jgi:uncharacterized protein (TIGR03084 family)
MQAICNDLKLEYDELDACVARLAEGDWDRLTPFYGWTIKDEISHLRYYDMAAVESLQGREVFLSGFEDLLKSMKPGDDLFDEINARGRKLPVKDLLTSWRATREQLLAGLAQLDAKDRLAWYGPDMSARSFATARIMEVWAHGQDIFDALKIRRQPTERLRHIAHMGVVTYGWTFMNRQLDVPEADVRVELSGPSKTLWTWGPETATNLVKGQAEDFCLVITQRRNVADTDLMIKGQAASEWMAIAQAFAGPASDPPEPGQRII